MDYNMNYKNSSLPNNHKNIQKGGEIKGERLENFRKKYGYFTKTSNLVTEQLKKLGKTRKTEITKKSDFCAYLNTKNLPFKFLFKNLNSSIGDNISDEFKEYFKLLKNDDDTLIIAMPLFVRFTAGLATNILFYNISKQSDNKYIINVERLNTYDELSITEVDDIIDRYLNVELSIDDIDITITIKPYTFNTKTLDIDVDDITKSLIYSLYFMYNRFENPDDKSLENVYNNITANTTRKEITKFASKLNILEDIKVVEEELNQKIDKDIIKKLLERPDLKTKNLISEMDTIFNEMEIIYEQFDDNAINIEDLTEQIESSTQKIIEIYEDKKIFYNDLKNTRKSLNEDIDNIYSELTKLKDAIIFGVENLILHRGIISKQLQKFEKLTENSKIYEEKKETFEKIKKNLENMVTKQQEYDNKITILKEQLENKKNDILEKNKQIQETDKQISTTEEGLNILKKKKQHYTKKGGQKMKNVISKSKKNNSVKIMKNNRNLLLEIKNILGGKSKSIPEKLNNNLNKILNENSNLKNKKNISQIIDDITPIILKYQQNIEKYHEILVNRDTLKKSLQEAFIKLRSFEQTFSDTKYKLDDQKDSIKSKINKMETIIKQMENDQKPQDLIDKIKNHKLKLIDFLNTRGNYIQKVEQLNETLVQRKNSLNTSKNNVRNKLKELQTIGTNLDEIKEELESHTDMYGGNILNKAILKSKVKKDDYLRYLTNPIEYIIKGGNGKISKLKEQWKKDEPDYIFNNFEFDDLKIIATKWGISNLDKFKNKKDLGIALKLILYIKTGFNTDFNSLVLVSHYLDIDISDVDKHNIGEIIYRINKKTTNIPFNSNIQIGGAFNVNDAIRFMEKNSTNAVSSPIIIHIPYNFKNFMEIIEQDSNMKIIRQKLGDDNQLHSLSTTKIKNGNYDGSYTAKILKLEDITDTVGDNTNNVIFADLAKIKEWWIQGKYLNKSPFNKSEKLHPDTQYISHTQQDFKNFVHKAIASSNSIIAIQDLIKIPEGFTKQNFENILQQHVNQLINLNSSNLNPYVQDLHNKHYTNIRVFKPGNIKEFKQIIQINQTQTKEQLEQLKKKLEPYFVSGQNGNANTDYMKHEEKYKEKYRPRIIAKELYDNGDEKQKKNQGLITGQIIGYKLNEQNPTDLKYLEFVIYNKFYKNPNPYKKTDTDDKKNYHDEKIKPDSQQRNTIKTVFNKDVKIISISEDKTEVQTGGDTNKLRIIFDPQNPSVIKGITSHSHDHPSKQIPSTLPESSPYLPRDPKSENLMDNDELENHINRIGKLLLDIKNNSTPFEPKTEVGIFNIIGDSDESNIIDRSTLLGYLATIETWLNNYKPTEAQVIELYQIIDYIRKFYKGNDFDAVIKSQKMQLLENLNDMKNINENEKDGSRKIPKMSSKIDRFINNFQIALQKYDAEFFNNKVNTKDLSQFIIHEEENSKGYLFKQHAKKLKKVFCKTPDGQCEINNKAFPVNSDGKKDIIEFIRFIEDCANQAADIENDIIFVETIISKLEELEQIFNQNMIKYIDNNLIGGTNIAEARKQAKEIKFTQLQNQLLFKKNYDKDKKLTTKDVDKMIYKLRDGTKTALLRLLPPKIPPLVSHVLLSQKDDTFLKLIQTTRQEFEKLKDELIIDYKKIGSQTDYNYYDDIDSDPPNITGFIYKYLQDIHDYIEVNYNNAKEKEIRNNAASALAALTQSQLEGLIQALAALTQEQVAALTKKEVAALIPIRVELMSESSHLPSLIAKTLTALTQLQLAALITELKKLTTEQVRVLTIDGDGKEKIEALIPDNLNFENNYVTTKVQEKWKSLMKQLSEKDKKTTQISIVNKLLKTREYSESGKKLVHTGGAKTTEDIPNIINSLKSSIYSSYRKEFLNTKKSSIQKGETVSNVNDRFEQLKQLAKLRRSVSKEIADDTIPSEETRNVLKHIKSLDLLIRENYVIDDEYKVSENVYTLIDENNPDLELPEYHLVSHLQFAIMVGFVNKFEKKWKSDESFHGKYETYIDKLLNGSIFGEKNKSKHFDIGNITDDKFLRAYYSDLTEYIKTNEINSFENFLHKTYTTIFSSSESPNDGYNEFWGKTMYDIGIEWEDLRENPDYSGLIPSTDLFGSEANVLSSFEQGLLFSFIIHAKDLINEESEETIQLNPKQKLNKFIKFLPRDTLSYIVVTLDSLSNNNIQSGGRGKMNLDFIKTKDITVVDGKHEIPGRFYFHKNLDNIKHLYIFQHKKDKENCKIKPLYPEDEKLKKKLQIPVNDFEKLHYEVNRLSKINNKKFRNTVGLVQDGSYESILLPNKSQRQKEIKKCAEYRITNTGKKFKGFSIWEFEKKDYKDDFIPLILWTDSELNPLEKKIISIGEGKPKDFQKKKYNALIKLIEKGDFGNYVQQKNKNDFNQLINKSTKKFWEEYFPKFNKLILRQDKTKHILLQKHLQDIIDKIISFLLVKNKTKKENFDILKKKLENIFKIKKNNKTINLNKYNFNNDIDDIKYYKEYIDEIKTWINNVENIVKLL